MESKLKESGWSKDLEQPIYEEWKKSGTYKFNPDSKKNIYSIDTPPPYVNAPIHMGHAITYILMDMFARFHRMMGNEVLFPLGLDRNGLPIEVAAQKKFNITPGKISREEFIKACKKLLEEFSLKSTETFLKAGIGFNSWEIGNKPGDVYETDSDEYRALTQATFIDLWKKGFVYEDNRMNNYCPGCRTTLADNEVDHADLKTFLNEIKFKVRETGEEIIIATTRPELLCKAGIVVYHPDDKRYQHLKGKTAIVPIYNLEIPIQPHPIAKQDYGTGIMYMSKSAGDQNAVRFLIEMKMQPESCITTEGKMDSSSGFLEGLKVGEARKLIIDNLDKQGYLVRKKEIMHSTPICERSKHPIEFINMPEYYLKQLNFLKDLKLVSDKINFYSNKNKQLLLDWINSVSIDWPISRRRVYATEIPLWYCKRCKEAVVPPKGKYYKPWKEGPPVKFCSNRPKLASGPISTDICGSAEFEGETRVFDTWFDSSISPLYILKIVEDPRVFKKSFPATLRPQGKEIVRTWLYYSLLRIYQLTGKPAFRDVWIHYHILDGQGRKMSKSLGNIIDPSALIDRNGAEPVRLWAALEGNLTDTDFVCSEEKIRGNGKFLTKLWNVARFISGFEEVKNKPKKLPVLDEWVLSELNDLVNFTRKQFSEYDFHNSSVKIRRFVWEIFASHYLELVKSRAYNKENKFTKEEQDSAIWTLNHCLDILLKLLAPVTPFITYKIYKDLTGKDIHKQEFPEGGKTEFKEFTTEELVGLNSEIWKLKKEKVLSMKDPVEFKIPENFKPIEKELKEMHNLKD